MRMGFPGVRRICDRPRRSWYEHYRSHFWQRKRKMFRSRGVLIRNGKAVIVAKSLLLLLH